MSIIIGRVVQKTSGIGADSKWKLIAADADSLQLKSLAEPALKWIGTYEQFEEAFAPSHD